MWPPSAKNNDTTQIETEEGGQVSLSQPGHNTSSTSEGSPVVTHKTQRERKTLKYNHASWPNVFS